jgi:hypothetical protein
LTELRNGVRRQARSGIEELNKAWAKESAEDFWRMLDRIGLPARRVSEEAKTGQPGDPLIVLRDQVDARTREEGKRAWESLRTWTALYKIHLEEGNPGPEMLRLEAGGWEMAEIAAVMRVCPLWQAARVPWWIVDTRTAMREG